MINRENPGLHLANEAREVFLRHVSEGLDAVRLKVSEWLLELLDQPATMSEAQDRRDLYQLFQAQSENWVAQSRQRLHHLLHPDAALPVETVAPSKELSLVAEEAIETQILAARAALAAVEKGGGDFSDLRLRLQHLESTEELDKGDAVQSLNVAQAIVDAWLQTGFSRTQWLVCQKALQAPLAAAIATGYHEANRFLLSHQVLPEIDLRGLVRRAPAGAVVNVVLATGGSDAVAPGTVQATLPIQPGSVLVPQQLMQWITQQVPGLANALMQPRSGTSPTVQPAEVGQPPYAEVVAQLPPIDWSSLESGAAGVRAQARALKAAVRSDEEKAVIEVVALIFEGILGEERIPPSIRVWFARLQMPVLRNAIADPSFVASEDHPARRLIDRMGACVLGFDRSVSLEPLEQEIKRIVQVIEQYPETGRRVFELMLQEFLAFLERELPAVERVSQVVDVAAQVEQREILTIQYTIELRKLLGNAPVSAVLRDFFFKVWAEVMAQAAVTYGAQDARAATLRQVAADLLWAASAKSDRAERARVLAAVPSLLARLRQGMALLGYRAAQQDETLKSINDVLSEAFISKEPGLDTRWLAGLTEGLATLENVMPEQDDLDIDLSRESLELITGQEATDLDILPLLDTPIGKDARQALRRLQLGDWFTLDHAGLTAMVQLAWISPRQRLYLMVSSGQRAYLMQAGRVAQSLQSGALRVGESMSLTDRATQAAMEKLKADPRRLLG